MSFAHLDQQLKAVRASADVPDLADEVWDAQVPLRTLQAWMGHADIKTTMVYTHYAPGANEADLVNGVFGPGVADTEGAPALQHDGRQAKATRAA